MTHEFMVYFMDADSFGSADTTGTPNKTVGINTIDLTAAPVSENEGPVDVHIVPPDPYKKFNYQDFPDGPKLFHGVGNTDIDDLNPVNPKPQQTLVDGQPIWLQGTFENNGESYYRSVKSIENGDWYAIPINAVTHDNEVDHLSSSTVDLSKKEKLLASTGTIVGLVVGLARTIFFKTKKG